MKKWNSAFAPKNVFFLLLLISIILSTSIAYAQQSQPGSQNQEITWHEESSTIDLAHDAWMLAVRYRFEETLEDHAVAHDPTILSEIASLRGDKLRYFLDSNEAINQVETTMFPPASPDSLEEQQAVSMTYITLAEERELVEIATAMVFSEEKNAAALTDLHERERAYVENLQAILKALAEDKADSLFTAEYLAYRTTIIPFIESTGAELFNPSQQYVDMYQEYVGIDGGRETKGSEPSSTQSSRCSTTNTTDNWPSKSPIYSGNTGSTWYYRKASGQNDCDIWVRYYMGGALHYGQISAGTSSAQCVLDKTEQLAADWSESRVYNYVQYGRNRVEWGWPLGCSTTGYALMTATKWRP